MPNRKSKSTADYAAIAVAPLLIFLMISSLAGFLVVLLYRGVYPQRVAWTLLMYTMGAVAIARITIENDRGYSSLYAVALGAVTLVTMLRFVGDPIFSVLILVVIGYLADRIVHDCTLVDESVDSSGQGLVDRISMSASDPNAPQPKGHQPGRTVLYLAAAALPLFGLGQFFLRGDAASWSQARWFLTLYLFSALSLLVVTSFLNLRRYLRQRHTEMPTDATMAWLIGGIVIIGAILLFAYLAPLPGRTIASMKMPEFLTTDAPMSASRFGWGDEAAPSENPDDDVRRTDAKNPGSGDQNEPDSDPSSSGSGAQTKPGGDSGDRDDGPAGQKSGGKQSGGKQSDGRQQGDKSSGDPQSGDKPSGNEPSGKGQSGEVQPADKSPGKNATKGKQSERDPNPGNDHAADDPKDAASDPGEHDDVESAADESPAGDEQHSDESATEASDAQPRSTNQTKNAPRQNEAETPSESSPSSNPLAAMGAWIGSLLRWILFGILATVAGMFLFRHLDAILAWWHGLFPGRAGSGETSGAFAKPRQVNAIPPRPFSSYENPIGTRQPRQVILITFEALEAWSREHGITRTEDETPSEFARRLTRHEPSLSDGVSRLVDAYNRIVYGRGRPATADVDAASTVWRELSRH
ncbi:MAG: DUF4129 domain-containing protein [Planctomycetota bacterium]